jgi:hypothetical protein
MRVRKYLAVAIALAASLGFLTQARADNLVIGGSAGPTINVTGTVSGNPFIDTRNERGGNLPGSTLNGSALPWLFCVDLTHNVALSGTYGATTTTNTGSVNGAVVGGSDMVADQIAYLLLTYASSAIGTSQEGELQAAIWKLEYGAGFTINSVSGGSVANALALVTEAQGATTTDDRTKLLWLSPKQTGSAVVHQGLVTVVPVPEPASMAIAGIAGLGMLFYARKRRSR